MESINRASSGTGLEGFCLDHIRATIQSVPDTDHLAERLVGWNDGYDREGRFTHGSGMLKNIRVRAGLDTITLLGSPAQFMHAANTFPFGPPELFRFTRAMAQTLDVPREAVLEANVTALDIALNVVVPRHPATYFPAFQYKPRARRSVFNTTLYLTNKTRTVRIYDKGEHLRAKRLSHLLTDEQRRAHVLRIEMSTRRVADELGGALTIGELIAPTGWDRVTSYWRRHYESVQITDPVTPFMRPEDIPIRPKGLRDGLAAVGVESLGGTQEVLDQIDRARLIDPKRIDTMRAHRLRQEVKRVQGRALNHAHPELARELTEHVERAFDRALKSQRL